MRTNGPDTPPSGIPEQNQHEVTSSTEEVDHDAPTVPNGLPNADLNPEPEPDGDVDQDPDTVPVIPRPPDDFNAFCEAPTQPQALPRTQRAAWLRGLGALIIRHSRPGGDAPAQDHDQAGEQHDV